MSIAIEPVGPVVTRNGIGQDQLTGDPCARCRGSTQSGMVRLPRACIDEGIAALVQCVTDLQLQLPELVAAPTSAHQVVVLDVDRSAVPAFERLFQPGHGLDRRTPLQQDKSRSLLKLN
jgi:hypothetical protein